MSTSKGMNSVEDGGCHRHRSGALRRRRACRDTDLRQHDAQARDGNPRSLRAVYGPIVGLLVGFLGHWLTDLFAGWGVWPTWMLGSAIVGLAIGLFGKLSKGCIEKEESPKSAILLFIILSFVGTSSAT